VLVESQGRASEVCQIFQPMPQLLRNVRVNGGKPLEIEEVKETIAANQRRLGNSGRLLIRKSGTEPLIRVMAECDDEILLNSVMDDICGVIQAAAAT
jgi:phosphoglucosamine mutase